MRQSSNIVGAVLAGGKSRRLGQDKAGLLFDSQTLLARNLGLLGSVVEEIWISGRQETDLKGWQLPGNCHFLPDHRPGHGPLGGLVSLLRQTGRACLVLPVDLPFMRPELLRLLLSARAERLTAESRAVTQFVHATGENMGRQEQLVAIYEQAALDWLEPCLASGKLKLGLAIPEKARQFVPVPEGQENCFLNINTSQDLEKARKMALAGTFALDMPDQKP